MARNNITGPRRRSPAPGLATLMIAAAVATTRVIKAESAAQPPAAAPVKKSISKEDPNQLLFDFIKAVEGYRAAEFRDGFYVDPDTKQRLPSKSIYYGHQEKPGEHLNLTKAQAVDLLKSDIQDNKDFVANWARRNHVTLNINQLDGVAGLVFNVGRGPVYGTLGKDLERGDFAAASLEFAKWNKVRDANGNLVASKYQTYRRTIDTAMFRGDSTTVLAGIQALSHPSHPKAVAHKSKKKKKTIEFSKN